MSDRVGTDTNSQNYQAKIDELLTRLDTIEERWRELTRILAPEHLALLAEACRQEMQKRAGPPHQVKHRRQTVAGVLAEAKMRGGRLRLTERQGEKLQKVMEEGRGE